MRWFERDTDRLTSLATAAPLAEVEAYWQALRDGRDMPLRSEIDPRGILRALPDAFILERIAPGVARIRVAGSHVSALLGMEARGMPASCLLLPASRDEFASVLEDVLSHPATARIALRGESGLGRRRLHAQMLLMPLRSDDGAVDRVLGCIVTDGEAGTNPRRFEMMGTALRRSRSDGAALPSPLPATRILPPQPTPQTRLIATKAPHLRLVVTEAV